MAQAFSPTSPSRISGTPILKRLSRWSLLLTTTTGLVATLVPITAASSHAIAIKDAGQLQDGIHVFGEQPLPEQLGTTYMVVEINGSEVVGGFYQPSSSFDCFSGRIEGGEMALTITDSYSQATHPYTLALQTPEPVASGTSQAQSVVPAGLQAVSEMTDIDRQVLQTCLSQF